MQFKRKIQNARGMSDLGCTGVHVEVNAFVPEWQLKMVLGGFKHA